MLLGIDLGGTKIEVIVLKSKENPEEVIRHRVDTEEEKGYSQVISNIKSLVDSIERRINHKHAITLIKWTRITQEVIYD